jgi:hypothetical protein
MYGKGTQLSKDRFEIKKGLNVFFCDTESVKREFDLFGLDEFSELD